MFHRARTNDVIYVDVQWVLGRNIQIKYIILSHIDIIRMSKPEYCDSCPWLFDKMGACQPTGVPLIFSLLSFLPYLIILVFFGLALFIRNHRQIKMLMLLVSCYIVGDRLIKNILQSPRPEGACKSSYGFPSSHMTVLCCYAFAIWMQCRKSQKLFLIVMIMLQGFARVQLKYHTWEQVVGGVVFAIVYSFLFETLYGKAAQTATFKKYCHVLKINLQEDTSAKNKNKKRA